MTEAIKPVLGDAYCYDSTVSRPIPVLLETPSDAPNRDDAQPTFYAVWRSFTQCTFIEDEGDVLFFRNQRGEALRDCAGAQGAGKEREDEAYKLAGL